MALRLDELTQPSRKKGFAATQWLDKSISESNQRSLDSQEKRSLQQKLRPWENYDDVQLTTRTFSAREALMKAQKIREKNDELARSMREGHVSKEVEQRLNDEQEKREQAFDFRATQMNPHEAKIKTAPSWLSFMRDLLKH